jgi:hypothetical protein
VAGDSEIHGHGDLRLVLDVAATSECSTTRPVRAPRRRRGRGRPLEYLRSRPWRRSWRTWWRSPCRCRSRPRWWRRPFRPAYKLIPQSYVRTLQFRRWCATEHDLLEKLRTRSDNWRVNLWLWAREAESEEMRWRSATILKQWSRSTALLPARHQLELTQLGTHPHPSTHNQL